MNILPPRIRSKIYKVIINKSVYYTSSNQSVSELWNTLRLKYKRSSINISLVNCSCTEQPCKNDVYLRTITKCDCQCNLPNCSALKLVRVAVKDSVIRSC